MWLIDWCCCYRESQDAPRRKRSHGMSCLMKSPTSCCQTASPPKSFPDIPPLKMRLRCVDTNTVALVFPQCTSHDKILSAHTVCVCSNNKC